MITNLVSAEFLPLSRRLYIIGCDHKNGGAEAAEWIKNKALEIVEYRKINQPMGVFSVDRTVGVLDVDEIAKDRRAQAQAQHGNLY